MTTNGSERSQQVRALLAATPPGGDRVPAFRFEKVGDSVTGTVVALGEGGSKYGLYPTVTIERPDGPLVAIHGFGAALSDALDDFEIGDTVSIRYEGMKPGRAGRQFKSYEVRVS